MAVRLGVSFDKEDARDWETVEKLAGAPEGTWPQADKLGRKIDELREQDRHDEADRLYRAEYHTPVGKLYRFTVFGFDRLTENARRVIKAYGHHVGEGRTGHPREVQGILAHQGVPQERRDAIRKHPLILRWG